MLVATLPLVLGLVPAPEMLMASSNVARPAVVIDHSPASTSVRQLPVQIGDYPVRQPAPAYGLFPTTSTLAVGLAAPREPKILTPEEEAARDDARRVAGLVFFFGGAPSLLAQYELVWSKKDPDDAASVGARTGGKKKRQTTKAAKPRLGRAVGKKR